MGSLIKKLYCPTTKAKFSRVPASLTNECLLEILHPNLEVKMIADRKILCLTIHQAAAVRPFRDKIFYARLFILSSPTWAWEWSTGNSTPERTFLEKKNHCEGRSHVLLAPAAAEWLIVTDKMALSLETFFRNSPKKTEKHFFFRENVADLRLA